MRIIDNIKNFLFGPVQPYCLQCGAWKDYFDKPCHQCIQGMVSEYQLEECRAQKNQAYSERNRLVAVLAKLFPSSLERHPEEDKDWDADWRWIVYVILPTGQCSWHIHDSELALFDHVPRECKQRWDGHTTGEKYARIERYCK